MDVSSRVAAPETGFATVRRISRVTVLFNMLVGKHLMHMGDFLTILMLFLYILPCWQMADFEKTTNCAVLRRRLSPKKRQSVGWNGRHIWEEGKLFYLYLVNLFITGVNNFHIKNNRFFDLVDFWDQPV